MRSPVPPYGPPINDALKDPTTKLATLVALHKSATATLSAGTIGVTGSIASTGTANLDATTLSIGTTTGSSDGTSQASSAM